MSGVVTNKFRIHNAEQFYESFSEDSPSIVYGFIGRSFAWSDDNSPPDPADTYSNVLYDTWRQIMSFKRINASDVTFCISRYDWTSGTVYAQYDTTSAAMWDNQFYVFTDDYNIYKCLNNNRGAVSTVKPTGTSTSPLLTADGYVWKYMGSVSAAQAIKFLTNDYIPVRVLATDDGGAQWDVQAAAANGAVESVHVTTTGSGYTTASGQAQAGTSSSITLATGASATNGIYTNLGVYIVSGTGAGQVRKINNYVGSTRVASVSSNWTTPPDSTSNYYISPYIAATGDGQDFSAYPVVTGDAITAIRVLDAGENYSWINLDLSANGGSGAVLVPQRAPQNGHGSDIVEELGGRNVMAVFKISGSESNTFTVQNDFRILGLIADPLYYDGTAANAAVYDQMPKVNLSGISGTFLKDEVVVGGTSGANGYMIELTANNDMRFNYMFREFSAAETITGQTSGATATVDSFSPAALRPYSGEILYTEHRGAVARAASQSENLVLVIQF